MSPHNDEVHIFIVHDALNGLFHTLPVALSYLAELPRESLIAAVRLSIGGLHSLADFEIYRQITAASNDEASSFKNTTISSFSAKPGVPLGEGKYPDSLGFEREISQVWRHWRGETTHVR